MLKTSILVVAAIALGASLLAARSEQDGSNIREQKTFDKTIGASNAQRLDLKVPIGNVSVVADDSRDLTVHAVRSSKRPLDETSRKWMNDSYVTIENRNGVLVIQDHPFGSDSLKNVHGDDESSDHGSRDLNLEVQVHLPANLATKIDVSAGIADVRGHYRSIDAGIGAGKLTTEDVSCDGTTDLHVGAGTIVAHLDKSSRGDSNLHIGAGEVKLVIPAGADADVSADVAMGEITGLPKTSRREGEIRFGDRRHGRIGAGDRKVEIHVGTGSVKVESSDRLQSLAVPEDSVSSDSAPETSAVDDADISQSIDATVRAALSQARIALDSVPLDRARSGADGDLHDLGPTLSRALSDVGPAIKRAMKRARPEIQRSLRRAKKAIERVQREAGENANEGYGD